MNVRAFSPSCILLLMVAGFGCRAVDNDFVIYADGLESEVRVEDARATRAPGTDLLEVQVPIRNLTDREIQLLVQVEFRDATGAFYDDETPKRVVILPRGSTETVPTISMKARASDFVVRLWRNE